MRLVLWWFAVTTRRAHLAPRHQLSKALHNTAPAEKLVKKSARRTKYVLHSLPWLMLKLISKKFQLEVSLKHSKPCYYYRSPFPLKYTIVCKIAFRCVKKLTCFTRYSAVSRMYIWRRTINYLCSAGNRKTCSIYF